MKAGIHVVILLALVWSSSLAAPVPQPGTPLRLLAGAEAGAEEVVDASTSGEGLTEPFRRIREETEGNTPRGVDREPAYEHGGGSSSRSRSESSLLADSEGSTTVTGRPIGQPLLPSSTWGVPPEELTLHLTGPVAHGEPLYDRPFSRSLYDVQEDLSRIVLGLARNEERGGCKSLVAILFTDWLD